MSVLRRARGRMLADAAVRALQGVDEAERGGLGAFGQVVGDRALDIPMGLLARDNGLGLQDRLRVSPVALAAPRARSRKLSKKVSFTGAVGADDAPASSRLRSCSRS